MLGIKISGIQDLRELLGEELGVSEWLDVRQEDVARFADATGDHQYIHVDPERAKTTFFGGTVAHGYLTRSDDGWRIHRTEQHQGWTEGNPAVFAHAVEALDG